MTVVADAAAQVGPDVAVDGAVAHCQGRVVVQDGATAPPCLTKNDLIPEMVAVTPLLIWNTRLR